MMSKLAIAACDKLRKAIADGCPTLYVGITQTRYSSKSQRCLDEYVFVVSGEFATLQESIAMYQQNERAYAVREKELQQQNEALRKANNSLHQARLDVDQQAVSDPRRLREDVRDLSNHVQKLAMDVQALMNPVEIVDFDASKYQSIADWVNEAKVPASFMCQCNSCKWERHVAGDQQ